MDDIDEKAKKWIKDNKKTLIQKFADPKVYSPLINPFTIFMAGSAGAGKTEYSKSFIESYDPKTKIVRIDADEIRDLIPDYTGRNAYKVQGAAALGVEKLFDEVQKNNQNAIVDGTFSDFKKSLSDVKRAINRGRKVGIFYIYQEPITAWEYTKKRERVEGRHVSKEMFINSFLLAKENVNKVKEILGNEIELNIVERNYTNELENTKFNIDKVDNYLKKRYNKEDLEKLII